VSTEPLYMSAAEVRLRFGVSRGWVERRQRDSNFPQATKFSPGINGHRKWLREDVMAWEAAAASERAGRKARQRATAASEINSQFPVPAHGVQGQPERSEPPMALIGSPHNVQR
jgi:predicted DNA-binding transcriptional regulator AlpA